MRFAECPRLLDPTPLPLEMGYERLDDGVLHVAARTDMHGCSGAMFEWWFGSFRPTTREYRWWHPLDHISSDWIEGQPGTPVGAIHQVVERFTGSAPEALSIQFRDPAEAFGADAYAAARRDGRASGAVCAHGGGGHSPHRRPDGAVIGTRLVHLCRDTPWGLALRTHFFLGHDLPGVGMPPAEVERLFPDPMAPALLQHCYDEFTFLARFLPSLHAAESAAEPTVARPW